MMSDLSAGSTIGCHEHEGRAAMIAAGDAEKREPRGETGCQGEELQEERGRG